MARPGHQSPEGYDPASYPSFAVTVDVVILSMVEGRLHVLLVQREASPYRGAWALPGGFKRPDESLDEAAQRELAEETGVTAPTHLAQFGAYGDPGRDPRTNVVTVAYLAVTPDVGVVAAGSDAADARLWPVREALEELDLAFDHRRILGDALERAADQLETSDLATAFVAEEFTISELQNVYEEFWGESIDAANFRRSLAASADSHYIEPTGAQGPPGPRGGRPPALFRALQGWSFAPPVRRPKKPTR